MKILVAVRMSKTVRAYKSFVVVVEQPLAQCILRGGPPPRFRKPLPLLATKRARSSTSSAMGAIFLISKRVTRSITIIRFHPSRGPIGCRGEEVRQAEEVQVLLLMVSRRDSHNGHQADLFLTQVRSRRR
ncbi:hypothetical protein V8C26DRAFT_249476 [Trichoderma gracile]